MANTINQNKLVADGGGGGTAKNVSTILRNTKKKAQETVRHNRHENAVNKPPAPIGKNTPKKETVERRAAAHALRPADANKSVPINSGKPRNTLASISQSAQAKMRDWNAEQNDELSRTIRSNRAKYYNNRTQTAFNLGNLSDNDYMKDFASHIDRSNPGASAEYLQSILNDIDSSSNAVKYNADLTPEQNAQNYAALMEFRGIVQYMHDALQEDLRIQEELGADVYDLYINNDKETLKKMYEEAQKNYDDNYKEIEASYARGGHIFDTAADLAAADDALIRTNSLKQAYEYANALYNAENMYTVVSDAKSADDYSQKSADGKKQYFDDMYDRKIDQAIFGYTYAANGDASEGYYSAEFVPSDWGITDEEYRQRLREGPRYKNATDYEADWNYIMVLGEKYADVPDSEMQESIYRDAMDVYYALYADDPEKAHEYALYIKSAYEAGIDEALYEWAGKNFWTRALATVENILLTPASMYEGAVMTLFNAGEDGGRLEATHLKDTLLSGAASGLTEKGLFDTGLLAGTLDDSIPIVGGKGLGDAYQLVNSDVLSRAGGLAFGPFFAAGLGLSAAASDYNQQIEMGYDSRTARTHAFAAGAAEAFSEYLSIDHFLKTKDTDAILSVLWKQGVAEASEESLTDIANRISDGIIHGDKSEWNANRLAYVSLGYSSEEASKMADRDFWEEVVFDAISAFVAAGAGSLSYYGMHPIQSYRAETQRSIQRQMQRFVDASKNFGEDTAVYKEGQKVKELLDNRMVLTKEGIRYLNRQFGMTQKQMQTIQNVREKSAERARVRAEAAATAVKNPGAAVRTSASYQAFAKTGVFSDEQANEYGQTLDALLDGKDVSSAKRKSLANVLLSTAGAQAVSDALGIEVQRASSAAEARDRLTAAVDTYRQAVQRVETINVAEDAAVPLKAEQDSDPSEMAAEPTQESDKADYEDDNTVEAARARVQQRQEEQSSVTTEQATDGGDERTEWDLFAAGTEDARNHKERIASYERFQELSDLIAENKGKENPIDDPISYEEFELRYKAQYPDATEFESIIAYKAYRDGLIDAPSEVNARQATSWLGKKAQGTAVGKAAQAVEKTVKEHKVEKEATRIQEKNRVAKIINGEETERRNAAEKIANDKKKQLADIEKFKDYKEAGVVPNTAADVVPTDIREKVDTLSKLLGVTIEYRNCELTGETDADKNANGWYDAASGHIVLDINPAVMYVYGKDQYLFVVAHEVGHAAKQAMGSRWSSFEKYAVNLMGKNAVANKQSEASVYQDEAVAREDVACDFIGRIMSDSKVFDAFLSDIKVGKIGVAPVRGLVKAFRAIANKLTGGKVGSTGAAELAKVMRGYSAADIQRMADSIESVLSAVEDKKKADLLRKKNADTKSFSQKTTKDSLGNKLSAGQQEYFKDSKVRDADGNLLVMYHGTPNYGFNIFEYGRSRFGLFGEGFYFTDDKNVADGYANSDGNTGGTYAVYLNISNAIDMDATADIAAWTDALAKLSNPIDDAEMRAAKRSSTAAINAYLKENGLSAGGVKNSDMFTLLKEEVADTFSDISTSEAGEIVQGALIGMGYDGITHVGGGRYNKADTNRHRVYIAFDSEQAKRTDNTTPTTNPDMRYSQKTYNINGVDKKVAWVDSNILSKRQKGEATDAYVQRYLTDKLRKDSYFLSLVESTGEEMYAEKRYRAPNQKVGLTGKYTHSDYNRDLKNNAPDIFRAKMRAAEVLGDIAAVSKYDKQSTTQDHSANKDAPGGVHYYNSTFVIPKFNSNMELVGVRAYDCRLIVDYGSDGKHHLYDIEKISRNEKLANAIFQKERQNAQNNSAPRNVSSSSADKISIAQSAPNVNTQNAKSYSQKPGNNITDPLARFAAQRRAKAEADARNSKKYKEAAADVEKAKAKYDAAVAAEKANPTPRPVLSKAESDKLKAAREKYGVIPEGENAARKADIPRKVSPNKNVSEFARTAAESKITNDTILPAVQSLILDDGMSYTPDSNDAQAMRAREWFAGEATVTKAYTDWMTDKSNTKDAMMRGMILYNKLATEAQDAETANARQAATEQALDVLQRMKNMATNSAQLLQLIKVMNKLSPDHQAYLVRESVKALNKELENSVGKRRAAHVELNTILVDQWMTAMKTRDQGYINATEHQLLLDIAAQVPATFADKWNAWRYLCMLGNFKTIGRNYAGNWGMAALQRTAIDVQAITEGIAGLFSKKFKANKDATGTVMFGQTFRNKTKEGKALIAFSEAFWDTISDAVIDDKYDDETGKFKDTSFGAKMRKTINETNAKFHTPVIKQWQKATEWALNGEKFGDAYFIKRHFVNNFAMVCARRGITAEMLNSGKVSDAMLGDIMQHSVRMAREATFHDVNAFSKFVSKLRIDTNKHPGIGWRIGKVALEGQLPFKKTPANILVRSLDYGPTGLLKALSADLYRLKKGKINSNQFLFNLSKGLTGTMVMGLGWLLRSLGILHGGIDDDEEREGYQDYSIDAFGKNFTLDWLAPMAVPLFMGATLHDGFEGVTDADGNKIGLGTVVASLFSDTFAPVLEMSMLSGIQNTISILSTAFDDSEDELGYRVIYALIVNNAISYLSQAIPTASSQLAQTLETDQERTYVGDIADPVERQFIRSLIKVAEKLPFHDARQQPYVDEFGRTESNGNFFERFLNAFVWPWYSSDIKVTDLDKELQEVAADSGEKVAPTARGYTVTVTKYDENGNKISSEQVRLNGDQYTAYSKAYGEKFVAMASALVQSDYYQSLTDPMARAKAITDVRDIANEYGKIAAGVGYVVKDNKLFDIVDMGIPIEEAYAAKVYRTSIDNIEGMSASEKMRLYDNYIQNAAAQAGWTKEQTQFVLDQYGTFFSQVPGNIDKYSGIDKAVGNSDIALDISQQIDALTPYGSASKVADWQKWDVIASYPGLTEKEKHDALYAYMLNQDGNETNDSRAFEAAHSAGVTTQQYVAISKKVGQLQPANGNKSVTDGQKWNVVASYSGMSESQRAAMLHRYMDDNQEKKLDAAVSAGVPVKVYVDTYNAKYTWGNGDGTWNKSELSSYLRSMGYSGNIYNALYNAFAPK